MRLDFCMLMGLDERSLHTVNGNFKTDRSGRSARQLVDPVIGDLLL